MAKIKVKVDWCDKNFGAVTEEDVLCGMVVATSKSYEGLMDELAAAVREHIEGLVQDGEVLPDWLVRGDYEFDVELGMAALHYASGLRTPRQEQRKRIIDGIHRIGQEFLSVV